MSLSTNELSICTEHPIGRELDALCMEFRSTAGSGNVSSSDFFEEFVRSASKAKYIFSRMVILLASQPAALHLPSRLSSQTLCTDLLKSPYSDLDAISTTTTALLLLRVVNRASDAEIWSAAYDFVKPVTPAPRDTSSAVQETPFAPSSGTVQNASETRYQMDILINAEMSDNMYPNVPDFFNKIFHSIPGLQSLVEDVFTQYESSEFPEPCTEDKVIEWFKTELNTLVALASNSEKAPKDLDIALKSRSLVTMPEQPLEGGTAIRKMDIGFASRVITLPETRTRCHWADVLVAGELKKNPAKDRIARTWFDLGRYVQQIFASQDTRSFVHGFTVCGDMMRVWMFDRGAISSAPAFSIKTDGLKFVTVMLGYLLMSESQLGLDPTVIRDGNRRYISIKGDRFYLEDAIHRSDGMVCRGTTIWKASLNGENYVIKDSWQYDGRENEGELLAEACKAGVEHIPECHYYETVQIGDTDDDLQQVRNGMDIPAENKYRPRRTSRTASAGVFSTTSSLGKRVASTSLDGGNPKRMRSTIEENSLKNRTHMRIITGPSKSGKTGKKLNLARTRVAVLNALIDSISALHNLYSLVDIIHRDVSIGNILISEDDEEGLVIDLDSAKKINRSVASGAKGRTGTRAFMSINALLEHRPQTYMDDLESIFWVLFWICIHYHGPGDKNGTRTNYESWNFIPIDQLGNLKAGLVAIDESFENCVNTTFTNYYHPLAFWIIELRKEVFRDNQGWKKEDESLFNRMKDVLRRAMEDDKVKAAWR